MLSVAAGVEAAQMSWRSKSIPVAAVSLGAWATILWTVAAADEPVSPREMDVWGRFAKGSWKQTRIMSETLDEVVTALA